MITTISLIANKRDYFKSKCCPTITATTTKRKKNNNIHHKIVSIVVYVNIFSQWLVKIERERKTTTSF